MIASGTASVGVATPTLMYIVIKDKAVFDAIDLPALGYDKVVTKGEQLGKITVIFQLWLPSDPGAVPEVSK